MRPGPQEESHQEGTRRARWVPKVLQEVPPELKFKGRAPGEDEHLLERADERPTIFEHLETHDLDEPSQEP